MTENSEEVWSDLVHADDGVFGSVPQSLEGRARSTSGSTIWRTGNSTTELSPELYLASQAGERTFVADDSMVRISQCDVSTEPSRVDECLTDVFEFLGREKAQAPILRSDVAYIISRNVPKLLSHYEWHIRARSYKLLRQLPSPRYIMDRKVYFEYSLMRSLSLDDMCHEEREQALKFIRWTMQFSDDFCSILTPPVLKTIIAVAEQADDRMRSVCLETLCEVLVTKPESLAYVNGIRTLTTAALDGPWSISISIANALIQMLERPETRAYIHVGTTLGGISSALTESMDNKEQLLTERAKVAAFMMTQFLKSWAGIQYFISDGRQVIKALVSALSIADTNRKIILGMLFELFGLSDDFDLVQFEQQPKFDVELLSPFQLPQFSITDSASRTRLFTVDYLHTILLMLFIDEGLIESLVESAIDSKMSDVVDAAVTLIKWLAQHPHIPLPEQYAERFQNLNQLVENALGQCEDDSTDAIHIICKIETTPSLSLGQLPNQQRDAWSASLSSSVIYRKHLHRNKLNKQLQLQKAASNTTNQSSKQGGTSRMNDNEAIHDNTVPISSSSSAATSASGYLNSTGLGARNTNLNMISTAKGQSGNSIDRTQNILRQSTSMHNLNMGGGIGGTLSISEDASSVAIVNNTTTTGDNSGENGTLGGEFDNFDVLPAMSNGIMGRRSIDTIASMFGHQQFASTTNISALSTPYTSHEPGAAFMPCGNIGPVTPVSANANESSNNAAGNATNSGNASSNINGNSNALGANNGSGGSINASNGPTTPSTPIQQNILPKSWSKARGRNRTSLLVNSSGMSFDESVLSSWIQESRVTTEDNPMRWDWRAIRMLVHGPATLGRRMQEIIRSSGFLSRLSRFYHPSSLEFCDLSRTTANDEYLEIGRQLIRILISSADGLLMIDESKLLVGIVDEIRKQNMYARKLVREESCFSFPKLQMTMSPGYFHFLYEIEHSIGGDNLLERNRLFDSYYQVVELSDQGLLIQYILSSMQYTAEGHARNILRKVASSPYESLRMIVPSFLLYQTSEVPCHKESATAWAIEVLVQLLYDPSPMVRSAASQCLVLVIDMAQENPFFDRHEADRRINTLLDLNPMLDLAVINDIRPLILRIMASSDRGFKYCKDAGLVNNEMNAWGALEGILYVQTIELDLSRALAFGPMFSSSHDGMMLMSSSQTPPTPPHLFGELAKTQSGREVLEEFGIPRLLFETLANIPWNSQVPDDVIGLKATLWAIGAVGASKDGYLMVEPFDAVGTLIEIATEADSLSIKGTCLYALAQLSRSVYAAESFRGRGWVLCSSCYGTYEYAVPQKLESILNAKGWAHGGILEDTYVFSEGITKEVDVTEDLDSVQREIIESIILMSNHVVVNTASRTLMRIRTSHPHYFRLISLYRKAIHLVGKYKYRLSARRFIYDIFDVNLAAFHDSCLEEAAQVGLPTLSEQQQRPVSRRFSSSSQQLLLQTEYDTQRKRASTMQEYPSSSSNMMFSRRPTNGLLDDVRPVMAGQVRGRIPVTTSRLVNGDGCGASRNDSISSGNTDVQF